MEIPPDLVQVIEEIGGGGRTRTYNLRIMRCPPGTDSKEIQQDDSVKHGNTLQDTQGLRPQETRRAVARERALARKI